MYTSSTKLMPCPRLERNKTVTLVWLMPPATIVALAPLPFVFWSMARIAEIGRQLTTDLNRKMELADFKIGSTSFEYGNILHTKIPLADKWRVAQRPARIATDFAPSCGTPGTNCPASNPNSGCGSEPDPRPAQWLAAQITTRSVSWCGA